MNQKYRVMQTLETREEVAAFEGTLTECDDWLDQCADQFPESTFKIEIVDDEGTTGWEDEDDTCRTCNGTGEGRYDGSSCNDCRGSGTYRHTTRR